MLSYHFVLEGKLANLERLCDRYLNEPSQGMLHYVPVFPFVFLAFTQAKRLSGIAPSYHHLGWSPEVEVAVFVLTASLKRQVSPPEVDHLAWFVPYIFVDNPLAVTWGREVHGFPKELGWIEMPVDRQVPDRLTLDAFALRTFSPYSRLTRLRLLAVNREGANGEFPGGPLLGAPTWTSPLGALRPLAERLFGDKSPPLLGKSFFQTTLAETTRWDVPQVFLKQFSAVEDGERACYQAIVESSLRVTNFRGARLLPGAYQFRLFPCDSHPIDGDLGLSETQPSVLSYWLDFDGILEFGRTVWEAPGRTAPAAPRRTSWEVE
jgi:hypothetical protein